jgi:hypothetical protein
VIGNELPMTVRLATSIMSKREPDEIIFRGGRPLFERWWLARTPSGSGRPTGNTYLHRFVRSDAEEPHDHPWLNETTVLAGRYVEELFCPHRIALYGCGKAMPIAREMTVGKTAMREADAIHRIVEVEPGTITLFETRRWSRDWGFWVDGRFVPWRDYHDVPQAREVGQ